MKSFCVIAAALAASAAANPLQKRSCNADNCLRALRGAGSLGGTSQPVLAMSDCSSFLAATSTVTVTPTASTIYQTSTSVTSTVTTAITSVTVTNTVTSFTGVSTPDITTPQKRAEATGIVLDGQIERRSAGSIPTYASACSSAARFISACSCIGIYPSTATVTTTLPTVSTTVTVLTTTTASTATTTTVLATQTAFATFAIQALGANIDGQYLQNQPGGDGSFNVPYFTSSPTSPVTCTLGPDRLLVCDSLAAAIYGCGQFFEVDQPAIFGFTNTFDLYCDIAADDQLTCDPVAGSDVQSNLFYSCISTVFGSPLNYLMQGVGCETNCLPVTVYAAPV